MTENINQDLNQKKILICGDSIARGVVIENDKKKYSFCENAASKLLEPFLTAQLVNISKFGNTITRGMKGLVGNIIKVKPDIVTIEFGGNDCDYDWDQVAESPLSEHQPHTPLDLFKEGIADMVNLVRDAKAVPVLFTLPPLDAERYFRWVSHEDAKRSENILKFLGNVNHIYWWQELYNNEIINMAQQLKVKFIDLRSAFLIQKDFSVFLCDDGIHPNALGQRLIAETIKSYIQNSDIFLIKKLSPAS